MEYIHRNFTFETLNLHHEKSTLEKIVPQGLIWNTEILNYHYDVKVLYFTKKAVLEIGCT